MSERDKVGKIKQLLKEKYYFSCELLLEPNYADISDPRIRNALKTKKPDLFCWNEKENFLFLIEAKEKLLDHKKAIDDIKERLSLFLSFPSRYKIVGLAFSGNIENKEHEITTFIIKKAKVEQVNYSRLIREKEYLNLFSSPSLSTDFQQVKKIADKVNEELYSIQLQPSRRIAPAAAFLLVLSPNQNPAQRGTIINYINDKDLSRLDNIIKSNFTKDLRKILAPAFSQQTEEEKEKRLETITRIVENIISATNFQNNTTLATIAQEISKITALFSREDDIGARFYRTFLKYWIGSGQDMGIVLTPWHIAELMVDLVDLFKGGININDICLDPCAGSGTFLLAFLRKQAKKTENIERAKENLLGCEIDEDIWLLSIANMLVEGDGKSNLLLQDFFTWDTSSLPQLPTIGLMNPPFSKKKKKEKGKSVSQAEILFVERLLDNLAVGGWAATITIISSFDNQKENQTVKKRIYRNHTLKAVINMTFKLFSSTSDVYTQVNIWQVHNPHSPENPVYFYDLADDGHQSVKKIYTDKFSQWEGIRQELLETFRYQKISNDKFFLIDGITAEDEWTFNYWKKKNEIAKNFGILQTSEGEKLFRSVISEYFLYQIRKKIQLLETELRINYLSEIKGKKQEAKELEKKKPVEWTTINNYLLYRWQKGGEKLQLQLSEDLNFYKRILWEEWQNQPQYEKIDQVPKLTERKWKEFKISKLFEVVKDKNFGFEDIEWGEYNYITSTTINNGIHCKSDKATYFEPCFTVDNCGNYSGPGISFYQDEPFCSNSAVNILKPKNFSLNVYRGLFLNTVLRQNMKYYHYGWKRNSERLANETIMLPINESKKIVKERKEPRGYVLDTYKEEKVKKTFSDGSLLIEYTEYEPDWEFMDIYIYIAECYWVKPFSKNHLSKFAFHRDTVFKVMNWPITTNAGWRQKSMLKLTILL